MRFLADPDEGAPWCDFGGFETLLSYRIDIKAPLARGDAALADDFRGRLLENHAAFLAGLRTAFCIGDYFFCHAGVRPGVAPLLSSRLACSRKGHRSPPLSMCRIALQH